MTKIFITALLIFTCFTSMASALENDTRVFKIYPEIKVVALQIMPDHLHGILFVRECMAQHLGKVIKGFSQRLATLRWRRPSRANALVLSAASRPKVSRLLRHTLKH